jgi:choice-of-anchor C domain-containing protein
MRVRAAVPTLALSIAALLAGFHQANANQIVNGSFEQPVLTVPDHYFDLAPGDTTITGWTITTGTVDLITDTCCGTGPADTGVQFVDLVGSQTTGGISQQFATAVNQLYSFSFAYSNNAGVSSASASVALTDTANQSLLSTSVSHSTGDPWAHFLAYFVATSALTTLTFTNLTGGSNQGVFLDSISVVSATPIPAALPLFLTAAAGLGFVGWRKRRTGAA